MPSPARAAGRPHQRDTRTRSLLASAAASPDPAEVSRLRSQVVLLHVDVADQVAARYRNRGIALDDLRQVAREGLVKAVARFDPALERDLLSYAVPTMRGELQRHFRDHGWSVRPPRRIQDLQWRMTRALDALGQRLGREPSRQELVTELGETSAAVEEAMAAYGAYTPTSLDQPVSEDGTTRLGEVIPDDHVETAASEARLVLAPLVRRLTERERRILYLRFYEDRTQAEIGEDLGVTQMQVSRLLARILTDLREELS